ncbi:hypothetical protein [Bathymodiolus heckerae thiotrophic gill symbiont]|uniref:hypothetical protein n=1 Tax=Bathymodiolus heckerae thiotrophic gill symbiont TaxID=1052212 RepID=UPI0010FCFD8C|nr:hypothetical protein [Bathymodiolus heckerae thiotrophic gill symbiont]
MKQPLSEKELIYFSKRKLLERITIQQLTNGHYEIFFTLKNTDTKYFLKTQRGESRTWVSLDRLTNHIRSFYEPIDNILLKLKKEIKYEKKH